MKKIECLISPRKFGELETELRAFGIHGMTVSDVRGFGREQTRPESFLFVTKTKVEIYCSDEDAEALTELIARVCRTGKLGDGKIAVLDVLDLIRVRTGERGALAL